MDEAADDLRPKEYNDTIKSSSTKSHIDVANSSTSTSFDIAMRDKKCPTGKKRQLERTPVGKRKTENDSKREISHIKKQGRSWLRGMQGLRRKNAPSSPQVVRSKITSLLSSQRRQNSQKQQRVTDLSHKNDNSNDSVSLGTSEDMNPNALLLEVSTYFQVMNNIQSQCLRFFICIPKMESDSRFYQQLNNGKIYFDVAGVLSISSQKTLFDQTGSENLCTYKILTGQENSGEKCNKHWLHLDSVLVMLKMTQSCLLLHLQSGDSGEKTSKHSLNVDDEATECIDQFMIVPSTSGSGGDLVAIFHDRETEHRNSSPKVFHPNLDRSEVSSDEHYMQGGKAITSENVSEMIQPKNLTTSRTIEEGENKKILSELTTKVDRSTNKKKINDETFTSITTEEFIQAYTTFLTNGRERNDDLPDRVLQKNSGKSPTDFHLKSNFDAIRFLRNQFASSIKTQRLASSNEISDVFGKVLEYYRNASNPGFMKYMNCKYRSDKSKDIKESSTYVLMNLTEVSDIVRKFGGETISKGDIKHNNIGTNIDEEQFQNKVFSENDIVDDTSSVRHVLLRLVQIQVLMRLELYFIFVKSCDSIDPCKFFCHYSRLLCAKQGNNIKDGKKKKKKKRKQKDKGHNEDTSTEKDFVSDIISLLELSPFVLSPPKETFSDFLKDNVWDHFHSTCSEVVREIVDFFELSFVSNDDISKDDIREMGSMGKMEPSTSSGLKSKIDLNYNTNENKSRLESQKEQRASTPSRWETITHKMEKEDIEIGGSRKKNNPPDVKDTSNDKTDERSSDEPSKANNKDSGEESILHVPSMAPSMDFVRAVHNARSNPLLNTGRGVYVGSHFSDGLTNVSELFREVKVVRPKSSKKRKIPGGHASQVNNDIIDDHHNAKGHDNIVGHKGMDTKVREEKWLQRLQNKPPPNIPKISSYNNMNREQFKRFRHNPRPLPQQFEHGFNFDDSLIPSPPPPPPRRGVVVAETPVRKRQRFDRVVRDTPDGAESISSSPDTLSSPSIRYHRLASTLVAEARLALRKRK